MSKKWELQDIPEAPDYNRWEQASNAVLGHMVGLTLRISTTALSDNKPNIATNALIPNGTGADAATPKYKVGELVLDLTTKKFYQIKTVAEDGKATLGTTVGTIA